MPKKTSVRVVRAMPASRIVRSFHTIDIVGFRDTKVRGDIRIDAAEDIELLIRGIYRAADQGVSDLIARREGKRPLSKKPGKKR